MNVVRLSIQDLDDVDSLRGRKPLKFIEEAAQPENARKSITIAVTFVKNFFIMVSLRLADIVDLLLLAASNIPPSFFSPTSGTSAVHANMIRYCPRTECGLVNSAISGHQKKRLYKEVLKKSSFQRGRGRCE